MKKILSVILALAMTLTALTFVVGAESIEETAKKTLLVGKKYSLSVPAYDGSSSLDLKIVMPKTGNLTLKYTNYAYGVAWNLFNSNGETMVASKFKASIGDSTWTTDIGFWVNEYHHYRDVLISGIFGTEWNEISEKAEGDVTYKLDKGTYYLRIARSAEGTSDLSLSVTAKDLDGNTIKSDSGSTVTSAIMTVSLKKGETLTLGAALTPSDSKSTVKWATSKKSVATVSSKGAVTAVAAGTADITATVDSVTLKIRVKVTE